MKAPIPDDDAARVAALDRYEILDSPPEAEFDAITKLAAMILQVPIALISLVDGDRQWFKARYGLAVPETPRDISFCGHVVAARAPMSISDAHVDPRFADNPLVTGELGVRFYAGVPLRTKDGFAVGTLCAIDHVPRELTEAQRQALDMLAVQVMALLELRRTGHSLRDKHREAVVREQEVTDQRRTLATLFESLVEGVVMQDRSGAILLSNPAAETILGLSHDQLLGRSSLDPRWRATRGDGSDFPGSEHPAMMTLQTGQPYRDVLMCVHKPEGQPSWIEINSQPMSRPGEPLPYGVVSTFRDVTTQRELSERLAHHQRLVTTGTLAAGVGHEINNPLSYLLTNLSLAIEELQDAGGGSPSRRFAEIVALLEQARDGGERVKRIVRGLKSLVREETSLVPTDVNAVVKHAIQMATYELRDRATIRIELAPVALVNADESRLSQVLINLIVNAIQAFTSADPAANLITITTRTDVEVTVEVTDNGPGIEREILPRIFDPFFTTKQVGVGTGLGLAISHGIVTAFGGRLGCETAAGQGTTFRVTLPVASEPALVSAEPRLPGRLKGRLLVVDDERTILQMIARVFRDDVEVVAFEDAREALRRLEAGEDFDIVICDLSMPNLSGMDFYAAVLATRPELAPRFVFISGDLSRDDLRRFLARVPNERLEKPVSLQNLRGLVRRFVR